MICQKYIARCYRVYQHERNENASFLSIFNGGGRPKWRFSNFPRFWKNSSALGSFNCIFENNSLKALFGQNMKKLKILKLSPDSRYLQKLALKLPIQKLSTELSGKSVSLHLMYKPEFSGRVSSVGRAFDCREEGRRFDSPGRTNTLGLKITEKWSLVLPLQCKRVDLRVARMTWQNGGPFSSSRRK